MAKTKRHYVCNACGQSQPKWQGRCDGCGAWNTLTEAIIETTMRKRAVEIGQSQTAPVALPEISDAKEHRIVTDITEMDRLFGGGIVPGSFLLVGGEPGIGKSTLLLQLAHALAVKGRKILYITGEESLAQVKARAVRLGVLHDRVWVLSEVNFSAIMDHIRQSQPDMIIVDSIQIIYRDDLPSSPGTVMQVRECANDLMHFAKTTHTPVFIVGHVTKEGNIAGPKVLEHIVDAVFYFEGDKHHSFRVLRAVKNRFGSTNEIAIFDMRESGLAEVKNPSELFLSGQSEVFPGSVIVATVEGSRPFLIELQALITPSNTVGMSRRVSTCVDSNRMALLIAIFEKILGASMGMQDVFVNLVGGMKMVEPALDLGIICAMASSLYNKEVDRRTMVFGEVGLGGEIRAVSHSERRLREAKKLGFSRCILPAKNYDKRMGNIVECVPLASLHELSEKVFA